jgi:predicted nucleic acid-binding Zn ribbon protein
MPEAHPDPEVSSTGARAHLYEPVVGSPRTCPGCGADLRARPAARACSARCRAALSRQRRAESQKRRDQQIRALLADALRLLDEGTREAIRGRVREFSGDPVVRGT